MYRQMETQHKECEEKLRMTKIENVYFKSITKNLEKSIGEMLDRDGVDGLLKNSFCSNDNAGLLEVSYCPRDGKMLTIVLSCVYGIMRWRVLREIKRTFELGLAILK